MTSNALAWALRAGLCLAALATPLLDMDGYGAGSPGSALAEEDSGAEKEAFDAAKALGTVEAWDAFLSHYPKGFHADLARAYVKKLAEPGGDASSAPVPTPVTAANPNDDFPVVAGSWGGIVRDGPGQQYRQLDSLSEGERITLTARTDVIENGYPWFKITYREGRSGYKWGGILCSTGQERPDLFKICPAEQNSQAGNKEPSSGCKDGGEWDGFRCRPAGYFDKEKVPDCSKGKVYSRKAGRCVDREEDEDKPAKKKPLVCGENYKLKNGKCVLQQNCGKNAYRSPEGDCYCTKGYKMQNGVCVWPQNKNGFEIAPWKKSGCKTWQSQCNQGNAKSCGQYEANCQVN